MTAKEGRKRSVRVLVAVGNGKGAAGEWHVLLEAEGSGVSCAPLWSPWVHAAGQTFSTDGTFSGLGSQTLSSTHKIPQREKIQIFLQGPFPVRTVGILKGLRHYCVM